jgi:hypothetical protein
MTESEWLETDTFYELHTHLWAVARDSPRKLRLIGCGFCRLIWDDLLDEKCREVICQSEYYADGLISIQELRRIWDEIATGSDDEYLRYQYRLAMDAGEAEFLPFCCNQIAKVRDSVQRLLSECSSLRRRVVSRVAKRKANRPSGRTRDQLVTPIADRLASGDANKIGGRIIHDLFGNPFRHVTLDPSWLTSTVLALSQQMYESRDFSPMPIIADALQDARCDNDDILAHCRGPGPHSRGCWAVDLVLGKS